MSQPTDTVNAAALPTVGEREELREADLRALHSEIDRRDRTILAMADALREAYASIRSGGASLDSSERLRMRANRRVEQLTVDVARLERSLEGKVRDCADFAGRIFGLEGKLEKLQGRIKRERRKRERQTGRR